MAPSARAEKAFSYMNATLGISKEQVKPVLINLLRVYEGNWELIEDENYRTLIEAYLDSEKDKAVEGERKPNGSGEGGQKSTGEPFLVDVDGDLVLSIMDSSSKMFSAEDKKPSSKVFEQKNIKRSQTFTEDDRPQTSSQALHSTASEAKKISSLPRGSTKGRESDHEKASSAGHRGRFEMNPVKPRAKKPKLLNSTNNAGDLCVKPPSNQDLQSKNLVPACINDTRAYNGSITIGSSSRLEEVKISLNCDSALAGLNFSIPDLAVVMKFMDRKYLSSSKTADPQFSTAKLLNDLCSIFLKLGIRKGSNSNLANSNTLQYASEEERKPFNFISDMTKGSEKVKISLIDEFGGETLPKFNYIPCNIIYQSAIVSISLARISDEGCCSDCSGNCLSSSLPCACARETGGEFAYTPQGLLKEEFLTACATMKTEPKDHHFVYCQECPLEKSKNEYMPERCKGHMVRKFIKECWRKCGCDMLCGNRIVQRGIACKLQVFLTREGKGWGLRPLEDLPKGTFVCEYVGEILTNMELYDRIMHESGNDRHTYPVTLDADWGSEKGLKDEEALCLDATYNGNVGRFINHRCYDANLIDIPVEIESPDHHYYHLAFFTNRNVSAYEELTWDYGIDFDDEDHPIKAFRCSCGSAFCYDKKQKDMVRIRGDRPTASARRRGQHEADIVKDDVVQPETSDVAQNQEQGIGNDGVGFPGGPSDTSLLTRYQDHVARIIWEGQDRVVKLVSHSKKVKRFGRPHPSVLPFVVNSGLSPLCDILYDYPDTGLILGFVERWHPETNSFHLPIGEMTISLDDVWSLVHLPITGEFCSTEPLEYEDSIQIMMTLLGVDRAMASDELNYCRGAQVRLSWLRDLYNSCCDNQLWEFAARAYLLHLVGCTIFANKSASFVQTHYLKLFRDLPICRKYAWGVAALVYFYEQLGDASFANTKQLAGYLPLLQSWIYEHFPTLGRKQLRDTYVETEPRATRYVTGRVTSTIVDIRVQLDALTYDGVIWCPYGTQSPARPLVVSAMFSGFLRLGILVHRHLPERVLRQFGFMQPIPRSPNSLPMVDFATIDDRWRHYDQFVVVQVVPAPTPFSCVDGYLQWFRRVSHPYIVRGVEDERLSLVVMPRLRRNLPDDMPVQRTSESSSSSLLSVIKCIVNGLQRMIDCRDVSEGTGAWDRTHELLQIARDAIEKEESRG